MLWSVQSIYIQNTHFICFVVIAESVKYEFREEDDFFCLVVLYINFWNLLSLLQGMFAKIIINRNKQTKKPQSKQTKPPNLHFCHSPTFPFMIWRIANSWLSLVTLEAGLQIKSRRCCKEHMHLKHPKIHHIDIAKYPIKEIAWKGGCNCLTTISTSFLLNIFQLN